MSYDVYFAIDTGDTELTRIGEERNVTYNLGDMFRAALKGEGLYDLDGKNAGEYIERLQSALADMTDPKRRAFYESMNPSNGWGNHDDAVATISWILDGARQHPKSTIRVV